MRKLRSDYRPGVAEFDWRQHGVRDPYASMWGAAAKLSDAKAAAIAKGAEIDKSAHFTPAGRVAAKRAYLEANVAPFVRGAFDAIDKANAEITRIRSSMSPVVIDKSDFAGALRRQELRAWLRGLPDRDRNRILALPELVDPDIAIAITEQPAQLSGVTEGQRTRLADRAIASRYPSEITTVSTIGDGAESLEHTVGTTINEIGGAFGFSSHEIAEPVGLDASPLAGDKQERVAAIGAMFPELPKNDAPPQAA